MKRDTIEEIKCEWSASELSKLDTAIIALFSLVFAGVVIFL